MDLARYGGVFLAMAVLFSGLGREEEKTPQGPQRRTAPVGGYVTADGTYLIPSAAGMLVPDVFPRAANRQRRPVNAEASVQ